MKQQNLFESEPAPWESDELADRALATIVLPEAPYGPYDYIIPDSLRARVEAGRRVRVPLGAGNRTVLGYCVSVRTYGGADDPAANVRRWKEISSVIDAKPLLSAAMLRLTEWMADYYLSPWGQVLETVVPAGVRAQAGTREVALFSLPEQVAARLDELELPAKQREVLRQLAVAPHPLSLPQLASQVHCTEAPIRALERKGLLHRTLSRVYQHVPTQPRVDRQDRPELNHDQQQALSAILRALNSGRHETLLVHGVTGSGKTELYMRAIEEVIHFGRQAIVLVPEISLTPQTVGRFRARFEHVAVLHSHLSPPERNWHWQQIASGKVQVVVGARSAVFAPTPPFGAHCFRRGA